MPRSFPYDAQSYRARKDFSREPKRRFVLSINASGEGSLNQLSIYGNLRLSLGHLKARTARTEMSETQTRPNPLGDTPDPWEDAYLRFETPEEEIRKFMARLNRAGAGQWSRDAEIVELFCGRGNGLIALHRLGFTRLGGVDLSPRLIAQYQGPAKCMVADCRKLPFANNSKDVLIVQGGLHHLPHLPTDLEQTFAEMQRVLRKDGRMMLVE